MVLFMNKKIILAITTIYSNRTLINSTIIELNNYNSKYSLSIAIVLLYIMLLSIVLIIIVSTTINNNSRINNSTIIKNKNDNSNYYYE